MLRVAGVIGLLGLTVGGYVAGVPAVMATLPLSPILLGAMLTLLCILIRPAGEPIRWPDVLLLLTLYALLLPATLGLSHSSEYVSEKRQLIWTLTPLSLIGGAIVLSSKKSRALWVGATVLYGAIYFALAQLYPSTDFLQTDRLVVEGGTTIGGGRALAAAAVALGALAFGIGSKNRHLALLLFLGAGLFGAAMLTSGSRGPLVGVLVALLAAALVGTGKAKRAGWLVVAAALAYVAWLQAGAWGLLSDRLTTLQDNSAQLRVYLFETAWTSFISNPFGAGWGALEARYALVGQQYPHNALLEVGAEGGILALSAVLTLFVVGLRRQSKAADKGAPVERALFALLVFYMTSVMVSGDINSNRILWACLGAAFVAPTLGGLRNMASQAVSTRSSAAQRPTQVTLHLD